MNNLLRKVIQRMDLLNDSGHSSMSSYSYAKAYLDFLIITKGTIKDIVLITIGIFSASFGFKGFFVNRQHKVDKI